MRRRTNTWNLGGDFGWTVGWVFVFLASLGAQAVAQLSASVGVEVTEEDGLYTYEYTVANSLLSGLPINFFQLDVGQGEGVVVGTEVDFGIRSLAAPEHWVGEYQPFEVTFDADFNVTGIAVDPSTGQPEFNRTEEVSFLVGDGFTCDDESGDIFEGESLVFSLQSEYAPASQGYLLAKLGADCDFLGFADGAVLAPSLPPDPAEPSCDFDGDGDCDVVDLDQLAGEVIAGANTAKFDLTEDGAVNQPDVDAFLAEVQRQSGDADLNGAVEFADFLVLSNNFGADGVLWSGGDFDIDGKVAFSDFLVLSGNFGQDAGVAASVPEPSGFVLVVLALTALGAQRRRLA